MSDVDLCSRAPVPSCDAKFTKIDANHPDEHDIIYGSPAANGARLSEEAIPVWERLTREYVEYRAAAEGDRRVGFIGLRTVGATPRNG